jgi:hypothetical protein
MLAMFKKQKVETDRTKRTMATIKDASLMLKSRAPGTYKEVGYHFTLRQTPHPAGLNSYDNPADSQDKTHSGGELNPGEGNITTPAS